MPVGDVFRIQVLQNVGSELTMNVLHARCTVSETVTPALIADMVAEMAVGSYTELADELSEDWRVIAINVHHLTPPGGVPSNLVLGAAESIVGGIESEIIPSASAVLISHYTATNNRSGRGRTYLPGLPESSQNEGQIVEARWGAIQTAANTAFVGEKGPFLGGDSKFRYIVHNGDGDTDAGYHIVTTIVRPNLATQRSRRAHPGFAT